MVHREELLTQTIAKVQAITGQDPGIIKAGHRPNFSHLVQVASVQTLINRLELCPQFDLLILDEAHHSSSNSWRKVMHYFSDSLLLGVSATPCRMDSGGFTDLFDYLLCGVDMADLIEQGYLSQYRYYAPAQGLNLSGLRVRGGDYTRESVEAVNSAIKVAADCLKAYQDYLCGKQTLIFAVSVAHSQEIAISFSAQGIPAAHLDGRNTPEVRAATMEAFKVGTIRVLSNCALFTEGLDVPGIDGVILARPTKSLGLWLQMIGRALRPAPGKDLATIIDLGDNWTRFGLPTDDREWSLDGVVKKPRAKLEKDEDGEIVEVVEIPENITTELQTSNLQLLEITTIAKPEPLLTDAELDKWAESVDRMIAIMKQRRYKPGWLTYRLGEMKAPLQIWRSVGRQLGFKPGWA